MVVVKEAFSEDSFSISLQYDHLRPKDCIFHVNMFRQDIILILTMFLIITKKEFFLSSLPVLLRQKMLLCVIKLPLAYGNPMNKHFQN